MKSYKIKATKEIIIKETYEFIEERDEERSAIMKVLDYLVKYLFLPVLVGILLYLILP
jgi:pyrroloquinoline quinone (PQQ) biosynthesis protein C